MYPRSCLRKKSGKIHRKEETEGSCAFEILQADHEEKGHCNNKEKTQGSRTFKVSQACSEETNRSKEEDEDKIETTQKGESQNASSSALSKLKRFVRAKKRKVKVHPIVTDERDEYLSK